MRVHDLRRGGQTGDLAQHLPADRGVRLDDGALAGVQGTWRLQHVVEDRGAADVVQKRSELDVPELRFRRAQLARDAHRAAGDAERAAARVRIGGVDHARERLHDADEGIVRLHGGSPEGVPHRASWGGRPVRCYRSFRPRRRPA